MGRRRKQPKDIVHVSLRMPEGLRVRIAHRAKQTGRSLNGELVFLLESTFNAQELAVMMETVAKVAGMIAAEEAVKRLTGTSRLLDEPPSDSTDAVPATPSTTRDR
jgi:hypothetical protein